MTVRALDAGWPAQTPAGAVADCHALGASLLMLYDADWSAPSANKSAAYLDAVDQGGIPVIPICTPSNVPPESAQQLLDTMVAQDLSHKFCMFDLEAYSFPPTSWVTGCIQLLHGAGWKVIGYGFESTKGTYWGCGFDYWLGVIDYTQGYGYIPPWCDGLQYTDKLIGPSGANYDGSTISDALWAAFEADPPTPPAQEEKLVKFTYGSPAAQFVSNGLTYVWIPDAQGITVYSSIFGAQDLGPINGLVGMGVPADPATAKMSGQPWPVKEPAQP